MSYEIIACVIFASLALSFALRIKAVNFICLLGLLAFSLVMLRRGQSFDVMMPHIMAGAVVFIIGYLLFLKGIMDGGVTKAAALAALWLPTQALADVAIAAGLSIGVLAVIASARKQSKVDSAALVLSIITAGVFFLASPYGSESHQSKYAHMPSSSPTSHDTARNDIPRLRLRQP